MQRTDTRNFSEWFRLSGELFKARLLGGIAANAPQLIAFLNGLFATPPELTTTTAGESPDISPTCSQGTIDLVVAGASVTATTAVNPTDSSGSGGSGGSGGTKTTPPGAQLAFTG